MASGDAPFYEISPVILRINEILILELMVVLHAISEHYPVLFLGGCTVVRESRNVFNLQPASPGWIAPAFPNLSVDDLPLDGLIRPAI